MGPVSARVTVLASEGNPVLNRTRVNERWRVVIAGLVAVLAIPILVIDSPSIAEGVVETVAPDEAPAEAPTTSRPVPSDASTEELVTTQVVTATSFIRPDVVALVARASAWGVARAEAIEQGLVTAGFVPPPSSTNLSLLPALAQSAPDPVLETSVEGGPEPDVDAEPAPVADPEPEAEPAPDTDEGIDSDLPTSSIPAPPAQVDGRVPPPAGGPTAAQWNALRRCESTHTYDAVSASGLYRGAYQFSQQTWDWVAGIHRPFLVGIDPAAAAAGWQDVMAYTLYAMRGWDQWPICGKNLL